MCQVQTPGSTERFAPAMNQIPKVVFSRSGLDEYRLLVHSAVMGRGASDGASPPRAAAPIFGGAAQAANPPDGSEP